MSVNTKFYTKADIGSFANIKDILKKELETTVAIEESKDKNYATLRFTYKGENRTFWVFLNSPDFDRNMLHTGFDLGCWGNSKEIMMKIAPYFGGWFIENDSNDEESFYIERTKDSSSGRTNAQKLYEAVAKEFGYKNTEALVKFIQENEQLIKDFNFGNVSVIGY